MLEVSTEKFSGPLGLLLGLIEQEELDITEISLAKIADEYVAYVRSAQGIDPAELADWLVVAAKLLYIKSKALLPYLVIEEEEEEGDDLTRQLRMYKEFLAVSEVIKKMILSQHWRFIPPLNKSRRLGFKLPSFTPPVKLKVGSLHSQFIKILSELETKQETRLKEKKLEPKINIDEKIALIKKLIISQAKVNFSQIMQAAASRTEAIVNFLAVLELAKQRELVFEQAELFSEINIYRFLE